MNAMQFKLGGKSFTRFIIGVLLALLFSPFTHAEVRTDELSPSGTVAMFYASYLPLLSSNSDPLKGKPAFFQKLLSNALMTEIAKNANRSVDYFTKTQDFNPQTLDGYTIKESASNATTAIELLTLGKSKDNAKVVAVKLIKEGGAWKIRKVGEPDDPQFSSLN